VKSNTRSRAEKGLCGGSGGRGGDREAEVQVKLMRGRGTACLHLEAP
jgi:hypothetical protein